MFFYLNFNKYYITYYKLEFFLLILFGYFIILIKRKKFLKI